MYSYQDSQQSQAERPVAESADHEQELWGRQHMMPSRNIPLVERPISSVIRDWNLPASLAVYVDHLFLEKY